MSSQTNPSNQTNVVIVGKSKSVGAAFVLALFFGPLGLLYASVTGGIILFLLGIVLFIVLPIVGGIIVWIAAIIWAVVAANNANDKMRSQARQWQK